MSSTRTHPQRRAPWHDAYDAQMALWRWYRTDQGQRWASYSLRENSPVNIESQGMLRDLWDAELGRLIDLDPICVSAEMCEVIEAASQTFQPEALLETDLITPRGFLYYERPFVIPDRFDEPTTIAAVSWTRILNAPDRDSRDKLEAEMAALDPNERSVRKAEEMILASNAKAMGIAVTLYCATPEGVNVPVAIIPMHLTPWYFGMEFEGNEVDLQGVPTGAGWWWRIVQTTFRLMQQHIAVRHQNRPDRASRREARSLRFPNEQTVVVVRLRREASERRDPTGESANYSHRFIRNGHWRNQWYPSIQNHRQIWISPTIVGDPGLPLIVKPRRVFQWDR